MKTNPTLPTAGKRTLRSHQQVVSSDREQLIRLASRASYVLAHDYRTTTVGTREVALDDLRLEYNNTVEHLKAANDPSSPVTPKAPGGAERKP